MVDHPTQTCQVHQPAGLVGSVSLLLRCASLASAGRLGLGCPWCPLEPTAHLLAHLKLPLSPGVPLRLLFSHSVLCFKIIFIISFCL